MPDQQTGELTANEAKACVYRAQGMSKAEAYKLAFNKSRAKPKSIGDQAGRLFADSRVQSRMRELLASVQLTDIITIGESLLKLEDWQRMAIEDRNHNALTSYMRMEMQMHGMLKDTVSMTVENRADDLVLLKKLAGDDKSKLAVVQTMLGAQDTFDEAKVA